MTPYDDAYYLKNDGAGAGGAEEQQQGLETQTRLELQILFT